MQDVSLLLQGTVSQVLIVSDGVYEGTDFANLLRDANIHVLLLLPSSTLSEEAGRQLIKHMRDVQVHIVPPLSNMQVKQQQIVAKLLSKT